MNLTTDHIKQFRKLFDVVHRFRVDKAKANAIEVNSPNYNMNIAQGQLTVPNTLTDYSLSPLNAKTVFVGKPNELHDRGIEKLQIGFGKELKVVQDQLMKNRKALIVVKTTFIFEESWKINVNLN